MLHYASKKYWCLLKPIFTILCFEVIQYADCLHFLSSWNQTDLPHQKFDVLNCSLEQKTMSLFSIFTSYSVSCKANCVQVSADAVYTHLVYCAQS